MKQRAGTFFGRTAALAPSAALALALAACGSAPSILSTDGWFNKPLDFTGGAKWSSTAKHRISDNRPLGPEDFVGADGQCAAATPDSTTMAAAGPADGAGQSPSVVPPALPSGGVALEMTECEVVRRTGQPDRVEIGANDRSERSVVITYLRGPRPGIYRFVAGRLTVIERAPEPAAPQRPARQRRA